MSSIREKKSAIHKHTNLGALMRKYNTVDDVLYSFSMTSDLIHEDMDFTVEEFCDWTGADMEELIEDLIKATNIR